MGSSFIECRLDIKHITSNKSKRTNQNQHEITSIMELRSMIEALLLQQRGTLKICIEKINNKLLMIVNMY